MTIRLIRLIALSAFLLLIAASVAATFVALQMQHDDALVINLAGRQRMLIQTMTLEVLGIQADADPLYREQLRTTEYVYFEQTLAALFDGGTAPYTDGGMVTLPATRDPQILAQLQKVRATWSEMDAAIHVAIVAKPHSAELAGAASTVLRLSPLILSQTDEAVRLYEADSARKVAQIQYLQIGFLAAAAALLIVTLLFTDRWVLAPVAWLGNAARRMGEGDLATPIAMTGPEELNWLAQSFDDMRQKLSASREQSAERLERISSLHDIDVAIVSRLSLQERLDVLLEKVTERLRVDAAAVALIDLRTRELVYVARHGLNGDFFQDGFLKVGEGIVGQVARSDQPMVIPNVRAEPRFMRQAAAERWGIVSYIAVPLRTRDETIGVLELATREPHLFPQEEVDFFVTLAGQAAVALENARLFEESRQRAAQRGALAEGAGAMLSQLDEEMLWPAAAAAARGTLSADRVAIFLYDSVSDRLDCPYSDGLSTEYIGELARRFREVPGGRLLADPRPIAVADTQTDPATAPIRDSMIREGFRSYAVFPLTAPGTPLGALVAYRNCVAPFTADDMGIGQTLSHIVAVALLNARLFESERDQLKLSRTLEEVGALLTSQLGLNEVLEKILDFLARVVSYDSVSIQLIDEEGHLNLTAGRGFPDVEQAAQAARKVGSHSLERKWAEHRAIVIPDTHADDRWIIAPEVEYIRSWVGAPLLIGDRLIGTLNVDSRTPNAYTAAVGETIMAFANQAAIAIENARLFEAERVAREQSEMLREAAQAVSSSLERDEVFRQILAQLKRVLNYNTASVLLLGEASASTLVTGEGYVDERSTSRAAKDLLKYSPILRQMSLDLQPVIIADVRDHSGWIWVPGATHVRSFLTVPIVARDRMIGALMLDSVQIGFFKPSHARIAQTLARHISVAIENARLYKEVTQRLTELEFLHRVTLTLTTLLDLDAALDQVVSLLTEELQYPHIDIALVDEAGEYVVLRAQRGIPQSMWGPAGKGIPVGLGLFGWVIQHGEPLLVNDVSRDARYITGISETRSELVVPLRAREKVIGVINAESPHLNAFGADDLLLLSTLAGSLAGGIERARLFESEREQRELAETLRETGALLSATLDFDSVLDRLIEYIGRVVPYDTANVMLLDSQTGRIRVARQRGYEQFGDQVVRDIAALSFNISTTSNLRRMVESRRPLVIPDTADDPDWVKVAPSAHVRSWAGAPIIARGQAIAFFSVDKIEPNFYQPKHIEQLATFAWQAALALENALLFESEHESEERYRTLVEQASDGIFLADPQGRNIDVNSCVCAMLGYSREEILSMSLTDLLLPEDLSARPIQFDQLRDGGPVISERRLLRKDGNLLPVEISARMLPDGRLQGIVRDITERVRAAEELRLLQTITMDVSQTDDLQSALNVVLRQVCQSTGWTLGEAWLPLPDGSALECSPAWHGTVSGLEAFRQASVNRTFPPGIGLPGRVWSSKQSEWIPDVSANREVFLRAQEAYLTGLQAAMGIPVLAEDEVIAVLIFFVFDLRDEDERLVKLVSAVAAQLGTVIRRKRAEDALRRGVEELRALADVSAALRQAQTRETMLSLLVETTMHLLKADSGLIALVEKEALLFTAARGAVEIMLGWRHPMDEDPLWQVVHTGEPVFIPDVAEQSDFIQWEVCRKLMVGLKACACVPLKSTQGTIGLLHLACRSKRAPTESEIRLLTSIAEMAGNALHRATLHEQTVRDAIELTLAYDTTIEGWSRALDLRDKETEGHTQRVTEMAMQLAQAIGIPDEELVHVRRGALLHDMGKMGVPDRILHKPGPLTDDEWTIMRQHPQLAYDMFKDIAYLRQALDIPYCHHEKWDGTGYPRGLKGEGIPLAARIFAIVDVWDALRSDRPYRKGWSEEKVREHIREQSGKHFDPKAVETFLCYIGAGNEVQ